MFHQALSTRPPGAQADTPAAGVEKPAIPLVRQEVMPLLPKSPPGRWLESITSWRDHMIKFGSALVLIAIPLAAMDSAWAQTATPISITLSSYSFTPNVLNLQAGTTYHLHFINSGSKDHNFSAPEFFAASQVAPEDQSKIEKGLVSLDSGQTVDVTVTPEHPGSFPVECTHFMHKMMGMRGNITVQ
jgi:plastocyanin